MDYSTLDKKSKRKRRSKSPTKTQERRNNYGNLVVNSQNAQTDMGVGPDSPGISSLQFGGNAPGGIRHQYQEESQSDRDHVDNTHERNLESALNERA